MKDGRPARQNPDGTIPAFDPLRAQRLAVPAKVYVEQFSAHPLEADMAELYGPPDGYIGSDGTFRKTRANADDKPVYEIELNPDDGLYSLPYMAIQADGNPWDEECASPGAPANKARQGFFPDGSRSFEEIDRFSIGVDGMASQISSLAIVDFYRGAPPSGYTKGLPAHLRTDKGEGDIPPEVRGKDFYPYKPYHLASAPPRPMLAKVTNDMQALVSSGNYDGVIGLRAVRSRGNRLLVQSPDRHHTADLRQCGPAAARPGQCRRTEEHHRLGRVHLVANLGRRAGPQPLRNRRNPGTAILCGA
jgi:hypothetical protein